MLEKVVTVSGVIFLISVASLMLFAGAAFGYGIFLGLKERAKGRKTKPAVGPGTLYFKMQGIYHPGIMESFFRKFSDAVSETSHFEEFYDGTVSVSFEVTDCAISENLAKDLEKAEFCITDHKKRR